MKTKMLSLFFSCSAGCFHGGLHSLGERGCSGGGSCMVLPMSTADGSMFQISAPFHISYVKNGSYYDTDQWIDPDFVIVNPENFYDREALTEYINQLC